MPSRKSDLFLAFLVVCALLLSLMSVHSALSVRNAMSSIQAKAGMVKELQLTDLCLFTDARYTRHPSMADMHTAFQDHPVSFEHFPSGTVVAPPPHIYKYGPTQ